MTTLHWYRNSRRFFVYGSTRVYTFYKYLLVDTSCFLVSCSRKGVQIMDTFLSLFLLKSSFSDSNDESRLFRSRSGYLSGTRLQRVICLRRSPSWPRKDHWTGTSQKHVLIGSSRTGPYLRSYLCFNVVESIRSVSSKKIPFRLILWRYR